MRLRTLVYYVLAVALGISFMYFFGCGKTKTPASPVGESPAIKGETPTKQTADGKAVYLTYCAACHGKEGKGDGMPGARNFTDKAEWKTYGKDEQTYKVISEGGMSVLGPMSGMPPFEGILSEQEIKAVLAYVKSLAR